MSWRTAGCLRQLIAETNAHHPSRPKAADGTIGDTAHAARKSSHNPDSRGVVRAWDCTTQNPWTDDLAERVRRLGEAGDRRLLGGGYVIFKGRIASEHSGWRWNPYHGVSPHFDHIHISCTDDPAHYDDRRSWDVWGAVYKPHVEPLPLPQQPVLKPAPPKPTVSAIPRRNRMFVIRKAGTKAVYETPGVGYRKWVKNLAAFEQKGYAVGDVVDVPASHPLLSLPVLGPDAPAGSR